MALIVGCEFSKMMEFWGRVDHYLPNKWSNLVDDEQEVEVEKVLEEKRKMKSMML